MKLMSIGSGSSGNCIYVGNDNVHLLVDAGISGKRVTEGLQKQGVQLSDLDGILITHEHIDHIKCLGVLLRKCEIPVYATQSTIDMIFNYDKLGNISEELFIPIEPDRTFYIRDMLISPAAVWHDAADPVCYSFFDESGKLSIATDLGDYDEYLINKLKGSDVVLLESNHDISMLEVNPRYSYALKRRILGSRGHLSNERSGELAARLYKEYPMKALVLGHLSKDNNIPECAFINMQNYMREAGADMEELRIEVASRESCSAEIML